MYTICEGKGAAKQQQEDHAFGSDSGSEDGDAMSDTEGEEEADMQLDDEQKLMKSVLSQFDDGAAAQEDLKQPTAVRATPFRVLHCKH